MAQTPRPDPSADDASERVVRRRPPAGPSNGRRVAKGVGILGAVVVVALLGAVGYGAWSYFRVKRVGVDLTDAADTAPQNYLVVGSDSRARVDESAAGAGAFGAREGATGQRSDSISIARIDPRSDRIDMLSIPRDLWLPIAGTGGKQRINTAYSRSTQTLIDTVEKELGIPVNHFVEVDFVGFQKLIGALGGVPMYFDHPVRDKNSGLQITERGCHVLDGYQGLAFARSRHLEWNNGVRWVSDPSGDLGRMTRQQLLARAALGRTRSMGLTDVGRLKGLVDAGLSSVSLDKALGFDDVFGLSKRFAKFDPDRLQTHSLPVVGARSSGGASIVLLEQAKAQPTLDIFRGKSTSAVTTTTTPPPKIDQVTVAVRNASGRDGQGRRISFVLGSGGFGTGDVDSVDQLEERSVIEYPKGSRAMAEIVRPFIVPAPRLRMARSLPAGTVRLVVGQDFEKVFTPSASDLPRSTTTTSTVVVRADGSGGSSTTTTSTTLPIGWTPGTPPSGVRCR